MRVNRVEVSNKDKIKLWKGIKIKEKKEKNTIKKQKDRGILQLHLQIQAQVLKIKESKLTKTGIFLKINIPINKKLRI